MRRRIAELLPTREELGLDGGTVLVGVGGTLRALARYEQWSKGYPLNKVHNYSLGRKSIMMTHKKLRRLGVRKIASIESLGKDRAESITAGSLVIGIMMNRLGFDEVRVSTHGLRDGILAEFLRDPISYQRGELDVSRAEESLASSQDLRTSNGDLIGSLEARGIISQRESSILEEAREGYMGMYMNTRPGSLFYSVVNDDSHLDHKDQVSLAVALVRAKAPGLANWFYSRYGTILKGKGKESIDLLAAVIQVMEILELTNSNVNVKSRDGALILDVTSPAKNFPYLFLDEAAGELKKATGMGVKTVVRGSITRAELTQTVRR